MRPSALYGTRDTICRVISQLLKSELTTGKMTVQGPFNKLDFSNVLDVAEYFSLATTNEVVNETFNCTRGYGRKIIDAAEIIQDKLGIGEIVTKRHDPFYPNRDTLNSDKAKTMLNFNPTIDIEEGISWQTGSKIRKLNDINYWLGKRAQSCKKVPKFFNKHLKFYDE